MYPRLHLCTPLPLGAPDSVCFAWEENSPAGSHRNNPTSPLMDTPLGPPGDSLHETRGVKLGDEGPTSLPVLHSPRESSE